MRKGQGLSITTIVVAAIALLILVVIVAIFTGNIGGFNTGVQTCPGQCEDLVSCPTDTAKFSGKTQCNDLQLSSDADKRQICCIPITAGN